MWNSECGMRKKAARGRSMKARPTQSRERGQGENFPLQGQGGTSSLLVCPLWGLGQRLNCSAGDQHLKRTQQRRRQRSVPASNLRVRRRAPKLFFSPRFREEPKNCLPKSNFSGRQEIHSLMANIIVDRYRSPVSGRMTTMFLPANSGRAATCDAAQTAAPDVMPASTPSCAASSRPVR